MFNKQTALHTQKANCVLQAQRTVYMPVSNGFVKTLMDMTGFFPDGDPHYLVVNAPNTVLFVQPYVNSKDHSDYVYCVAEEPEAYGNSINEESASYVLKCA